MNLFDAVIYGVVEGITEFLPISSTGHLMLTSFLLKSLQTNFLKSFEIAIQLGAILSVVVLYAKRPFTDKKVIKRVIVAFLPTAVVGFGLYKVIKGVLLENTQIVLWSLFLGGIVLIIFELFHPLKKFSFLKLSFPEKVAGSEGAEKSELADKENENSAEDLAKIPYLTSFLIGIFQSLAVIPGVSRAAATIIGGLALGLKRKTIVEFSFLLAVPTMLAATGFDLIKNAGAFSIDDFWFLAVGFVTSFIVALLSIKFLLKFIKTHTFISFGVYRILLALLFWIILL